MSLRGSRNDENILTDYFSNRHGIVIFTTTLFGVRGIILMLFNKNRHEGKKVIKTCDH